MKIGDQVYCKYEFIVDSYNIRNETMHILLVDASDRPIDSYTLPLYLGNLGLYPPDIDFCMPGPYLKDGHPDYYKSNTDEFDMNLGVMHEGAAYTIRISEDFTYSGKYSLVPVHSRHTIVKNAKLKTEQERVEYIESILSEKFSGKNLLGRIVHFYQADYTGKFVKLLPRDLVVTRSQDTNRDSPIFAQLHDNTTHVEYGIRVCYLIHNLVL